jgi:hypothetical protein
MLKTAFGFHVMEITQTFEWFTPFRIWEISVKNCQRSVHLSSGRTEENVEKVREIYIEDRRSIFSEIRGMLCPSHGTFALGA